VPRRPGPNAAKRLVRDGWDRASTFYRGEGASADVYGHDSRDHRAWLRPVMEGLPRGAAVLDLGCGVGVPDAALLATRFAVTGVDISPVQIERAKRLVPRATFVRADMTQVEFPAGTFGAVVCLYALIHVPLKEQRPLLERIHRWLARPGWLVVITGHEAYEGTEDDWLGSGAPMYWSHADASTYRGWFEELGFEVIDQRLVPEGASGHELFLLRVPRGRDGRAVPRGRGRRSSR